MAALRSQTVVDQGRSLQDFAEHAAAISRLTEIEQELGAAQVDLQAAKEPARDGSSHSERAEREAVAALLAGGGVAVAAPPSVAEMSQKVRIFELAARQQSAAVSEIESRIEREVTAADERTAFDVDAVEVVHLLRSAIVAHQRLADRRASVRRRFRGSCSLPELNLSGDMLRLLPAALQSFREGAMHLGIKGID